MVIFSQEVIDGYGFIDEMLFEDAGQQDALALPSSYRFYFHIGSVDSFEKQLEDSQTQLGIPTSDFIPVKYITQWSIIQEIIR